MHYAVLLRPSFGFSLSQLVRADAQEVRGDDTVFLREGRVVYTVPTRHIDDAVVCETQRQASERAREHREALIGARALRVVEGSAAPRGKRAGATDQDGPQAPAAFAEGFSVRMKQ